MIWKNILRKVKSVLHIAAIIAFALSIIFLAWSVSHGVWTWQLFMVIGLFCWCLSGKWDRMP